ncbi:hypothetical protein B6S09_16060 [Oceanimonas baumannii]|uniref:Uncharacterized protein n=1 Tax=Oceanimonas baumannii TaxID=129578 RepID=A0A235CAJ4_9GAMM|nr:hypothetical protein [Oceanimonas baumannii]OYD21436.1 hypothetical protein B6S09_16060 [Oceanimonas baumannii]
MNAERLADYLVSGAGQAALKRANQPAGHTWIYPARTNLTNGRSSPPVVQEHQLLKNCPGIWCSNARAGTSKQLPSPFHIHAAQRQLIIIPDIYPPFR